MLVFSFQRLLVQIIKSISAVLRAKPERMTAFPPIKTNSKLRFEVVAARNSSVDFIDTHSPNKSL
jgi:hypothetical protein